MPKPVQVEKTSLVSLQDRAQDSGFAWNTASIVFVNQTAEASVAGYELSGLQLTPMSMGGPADVLPLGMASGTTETVTLPATGKVRVGTGLDGFIWVSYTMAAGGKATQAQIASVTAKAT